MPTYTKTEDYRRARAALTLHAKAIMAERKADCMLVETPIGRPGEVGAHARCGLHIRGTEAWIGERLGAIAQELCGAYLAADPDGHLGHKVEITGPIEAVGENPPGPPPYRLSPALDRDGVVDACFGAISACAAELEGVRQTKRTRHEPDGDGALEVMGRHARLLADALAADAHRGRAA